MAVRDEGTVPCNNDLLAENFIDTGGEFRLIDYEYSGKNDACFELGNVWSESNLSLDQLDELVTHYYGRPLRNRMARARLWGLMSKYGWTLWASIQDGVSDIDFDFWAWGMEKYERAVAEFDGPDFERLLDEVRAGGTDSPSLGAADQLATLLARIGIVKRTDVPPPGADSIAKVPPATRTRSTVASSPRWSRIPRRPVAPLDPAGVEPDAVVGQRADDRQSAPRAGRPRPAPPGRACARSRSARGWCGR